MDRGVRGCTVKFIVRVVFHVKWVKSHVPVLESLVYVVGYGCTTWILTLAGTAPRLVNRQLN
jgi:hypothetical protein